MTRFERYLPGSRDRIPIGLLGPGLLAAWFWLLVLPGRLPTPTLDPSWQAVLNYAVVHHLKHGADIVFTYGPLGYLMQNSFCGGTWLRVVFFQFISRALYVALVWRLARSASGDGKSKPALAVGFLAASLWLPALDTDSFYLLFITLTGVALCAPGRAVAQGTGELPQRAIGFVEITALVLVALFALMKASLLAAGFAMLGCVMLWCVLQRQWLLGLTCPALYAISFLSGWRVVGQQSFSNLLPWLRATGEAGSSYQATMGLLPNPNQLVCGLTVFVCVLAALGLALRAHRRSLPLVLLLFCGLGLAWKQSFTRADEYHTRTFFIYALVLAASLPSLIGLAMNRAVLVFLAGLCLGGSLFVRLPVPIYRAFENARFLVRLPRMNGLWAAQARSFDLPQFRAILGSATVDVTGAEQAIAILNGFNYHPAPVFQPYAAGTPYLARLNADFYRSGRAPEFIITQDYTIDGRLPNLDASLSGAVITQCYRPVAAERGYRLLRRVERSPQAPTPVATGQLALGERLPVQGANWCVLTLHETALGRLVRSLWMTPPVDIQVWRNQEATTYRFVPSMGQSGFVVPEGLTSLAIQPARGLRFLFQLRLDYQLARLSPATGE